MLRWMGGNVIDRELIETLGFTVGLTLVMNLCYDGQAQKIGTECPDSPLKLNHDSLVRQRKNRPQTPLHGGVMRSHTRDH
jgi:hypothetical protein